jgi:tetrahydromethanopterin S-methyltransferase subunit G
MRGVSTKIDDNRKLLSRTREEVAKEYALKDDVEKDLNKIMDRFDRVENKLDNLMERIIK